jgi:genome maintenance exonuclease 1
MKTFEHAFLEFEPLKTVTMHDKRYYELPDGSLAMSVTSQIGEALDKSALERWKTRVGEEEARKVTTQAANRGSAFHSICEKYLLNEDYKKGAMPVNLHSFQDIQDILDWNVGLIYGIEAPLYSYKLRAAGRTDCIAEWDGIPSIIDFKTSRKPKKEEWIQGYFLQATTYALMAEERTGMCIPRITIVISVDNEHPQVFVKEKEQFVNRVLQIFEKEV